jgi:hypothetical protein
MAHAQKAKSNTSGDSSRNIMVKAPVSYTASQDPAPGSYYLPDATSGTVLTYMSETARNAAGANGLLVDMYYNPQEPANTADYATMFNMTANLDGQQGTNISVEGNETSVSVNGNTTPVKLACATCTYNEINGNAPVEQTLGVFNETDIFGSGTVPSMADFWAVGTLEGSGNVQNMYGYYTSNGTEPTGANGSVGNMYGFYTQSGNGGGTLQWYYGNYAQLVNMAGTTSNSADFYAAAPTNFGASGGTLTNSYGVYIEDQTGGTTGGTVTNAWQVYSAGTAPSYFAGPIQLAYTLPTTLYSGAGTALPSCTSAMQGAQATVSDASEPRYMRQYVSGGAMTVPVVCSFDGSNYSWLTH